MSTEGCPDYDPVYSDGINSGGPCWTCRDDPYACAYSGFVLEDPTHGTVEEEMLANLHFKCDGCGKLHGYYTGTVCPCGEPFPYKYKWINYR